MVGMPALLVQNGDDLQKEMKKYEWAVSPLACVPDRVKSVDACTQAAWPLSFKHNGGL